MIGDSTHLCGYKSRYIIVHLWPLVNVTKHMDINMVGVVAVASETTCPIHAHIEHNMTNADYGYMDIQADCVDKLFVCAMFACIYAKHDNKCN